MSNAHNCSIFVVEKKKLNSFMSFDKLAISWKIIAAISLLIEFYSAHY